MNTAINEAARILADADSLLVITGAGISAESGLRTFRGNKGLYEEWPDLTAVLSAEGFARHPVAVWDFINQFRIQAAAASPNAAHRILAEWELSQRFNRFLIATQNIDGLHQAAGSRRVSELHGTAWQIACPRELDFANDESFARDFQKVIAGGPDIEPILRRWSEQNKRTIWEDRDVPWRTLPPYQNPDARPNVLLFDEQYGDRLLWVRDFIRRKPDAVLVVGCSGTLMVLPQLINDCRQANPSCRVINLNPDQELIIPDAIHIVQSATAAMTQLSTAAPLATT
jgi:NAD-dependent SIR2 family protein deacetylase